MSFIFAITLSPEDALSKEDLEGWHPLDSKVELHLGKSMFSKRGRFLHVGKVGKRWQGSAALLTDNADPDAEFWDMEPDLLPDLARLLKIVREHTKSCFILEAYWVGKGSRKPMEISVDELGRVIEEGRLSTKAHLLVC